MRGKEDPNSSLLNTAVGNELFWALKDVSFDVRQGEAIGIVGSNGAGKSTLLKVLSRITSPTRGEIKIKGRVASLLEVGTGFHPELSGRENIFLNGAILGMSKVEVRSRFDEIVAFSEVEKFIDTPVKRYSSGMYVRLAFAVAAHLEPEILIVDEVLAVGDAAFRNKCLGKMNDVANRGRTVLFVSHNITQIRRLCNRGIWLENGKVRQIGDAIDVTLAYEADKVDTSQGENGVFIRKGNRSEHVWIDKVEMFSEDGERSARFRYNDTMNMHIHLKHENDKPIDVFNQMALVWTLTDENGTRISSNSSLYESVFFDIKSSILKCQILNLPLYKGTYKLELGITSESVGRIDTWRDDIGFDVFISDPVGLGCELDRRSGFVHIASKWYF